MCKQIALASRRTEVIEHKVNLMLTSPWALKDIGIEPKWDRQPLPQPIQQLKRRLHYAQELEIQLDPFLRTTLGACQHRF